MHSRTHAHPLTHSHSQAAVRIRVRRGQRTDADTGASLPAFRSARVRIKAAPRTVHKTFFWRKRSSRSCFPRLFLHFLWIHLPRPHPLPTYPPPVVSRHKWYESSKQNPPGAQSILSQKSFPPFYLFLSDIRNIVPIWKVEFSID